jgi:hypothetical protein
MSTTEREPDAHGSLQVDSDIQMLILTLLSKNAYTNAC